VAAFISLHVAICATLCVFAVLLDLRRAWRVTAFGYLALTSVSTIYFGWHYLVDLLGGAALGVAAAWLAARGVGTEFRRVPASERETEQRAERVAGRERAAVVAHDTDRPVRDR
jgi:membrane-associated phospholipid phosphatase